MPNPTDLFDITETNMRFAGTPLALIAFQLPTSGIFQLKAAEQSVAQHAARSIACGCRAKDEELRCRRDSVRSRLYDYDAIHRHVFRVFVLQLSYIGFSHGHGINYVFSFQCPMDKQCSWFFPWNDTGNSLLTREHAHDWFVRCPTIEKVLLFGKLAVF